MNAAGSLGFAPDLYGPTSFEQFGAFVTNPISTRARRVANPPSLYTFPGGILLHSGHPNPGISGAIKTYASSWARAPLPIVIHLLSGKPEEIRKAILRIEELENIIAIEISFETDSATDLVKKVIRAVLGELPVIAQLPLPRALDLAEAAIEAGAAAVSLGPPRGALPGADGKLVSGRLYGPAIFPQALETVRQLSGMGYSVIGAGGVENEKQANSMLAAGAIAAQVDVGIWKTGNI